MCRANYCALWAKRTRWQHCLCHAGAMVFVPWAEFLFTFGGRVLSSDMFVTLVTLVWYMYGTCSFSGNGVGGDCFRWSWPRGPRSTHGEFQVSLWVSYHFTPCVHRGYSYGMFKQEIQNGRQVHGPPKNGRKELWRFSNGWVSTTETCNPNSQLW